MSTAKIFKYPFPWVIKKINDAELINSESTQEYQQGEMEM
jgi:hypothetical protein